MTCFSVSLGPNSIPSSPVPGIYVSLCPLPISEIRCYTAGDRPLKGDEDAKTKQICMRMRNGKCICGNDRGVGNAFAVECPHPLPPPFVKGTPEFFEVETNGIRFGVILL